ncbi:MAG: hypothetical protein ACRDST_20925, partial [Pseudonocardiaceae bacterium]
MSDVDGRRERAAQRSADHCAGTVGEQHAAQVVVVSGHRGAFHVGHAFAEVVDAQRDRGGQQRRHLREAVDQQ